MKSNFSKKNFVFYFLFRPIPQEFLMVGNVWMMDNGIRTGKYLKIQLQS